MLPDTNRLNVKKYCRFKKIYLIIYIKDLSWTIIGYLKTSLNNESIRSGVPEVKKVPENPPGVVDEPRYHRISRALSHRKQKKKEFKK